MLTRKTIPPKGVLHVSLNEPMFGLERFEPSQSLSPFIEHYWAVIWDHQPRVLRETVPHPSVHLVFEPSQSQLHGIHLKRFSRWIEGSGRVLGVKFRPGGFRPFYQKDVRFLTNTIVSPLAVFGPAIAQLETIIADMSSADAAFDRIDSFLTQIGPNATEELELANRIVQVISTNRSITRVEMISENFGIGLRTLQRLFLGYVGVSPKWVIQRFRLIEAAERMRDTSQQMDFAMLALELGYSDQSHLIRDFKVMVGMTPAQYRRSLNT